MQMIRLKWKLYLRKYALYQENVNDDWTPWMDQMVECIIAKVCVEFGAFGDCTAFINKGPKNKIFGDLLNKCG